MKTIQRCLIILILLVGNINYAQVSINMDGSDPDGSAMLDVQSSDKGFLPPRMTQEERDLISDPATGLMIYNTTTNQPNFFNGTAWMNFDGTTASSNLEVGDFYQGGIIAYILQPGDPGYIDNEQHGFIAASGDQSAGIQWYNGTYIYTGATATVLGTGPSNTTTIVAVQGLGSYAACLCEDLILNDYSDWYLPSKDELDKIFINKDVIGNFQNAYYWSSSEYNESFAYLQSFQTGSSSINGKGNIARVRALRSF